MMKKSILTLILIGCGPISLAQICPSSIKSVDRLENGIDGWQVEESSQTSALTGMTIADVFINNEGKKENAELRPMRDKAGSNYWRFEHEVGKNEVLMQCGYAGTKITLSTRVNSDVVECFEKATGTQKERKYIAKCVNAIQKNKGPV
ncbi:MAG: STY0301 family protein [Pseudomonadota bacterium]